MGKRQEMRARRRRQQMTNRIAVIGLVIVGALLITVALALPAINTANQRATQQAALTVAPATQQAALTQIPIVTITPRTFTAPVNGSSVGDPDAPVKVDVWEDFQCPACKTYAEKYETLVIQNYVETGKVYYTVHFYPVISNYSEGNTESEHSSNAALCAADQGKFWDYHDIIFANWNGENQGAFADYRLVAFAQAIGLDMDQWNECFTSDLHADFIAADMQTGTEWGVSGTPSVFVNGTIISPGYIATYDQIAAAIDAILAEK
jgi:protein-disulfide isomerase